MTRLVASVFPGEHAVNSAEVVSVNVGAVREIEWRGERVRTGIWKLPVEGRVAIRGVNLAGDDQADRRVHGGVDKAVYAYAVEDYAFWRDERQVDTVPGLFGENLTTRGLDLRECVVGERWRVGSALLEVAQPRLPCFKLGARMNDARFPKAFQAEGRMGAYLRIIDEGEVGTGDAIDVVARPAHGIRLRDMLRALDDEAMAHRLRELPYLPRFWNDVARGPS
jgi:MOSC domain-containing protein YiiM